MKLADQLYTQSHILSSQSNAQGVNAPRVSGTQQEIADDSKVEHSLSSESGRSSQYPMASEQEIQTVAKQARSFFFKIKPPKPTPTPVPKPPVKPAPKPPVTPTPTPKPTPTPSKPAGGPNGAGDAVNSSKTISNFHNSNAFPPIARQLAASARSSLISTLVNLPFSVGEHIASKAITDRVDAQAKMPGAEKKNADGTISTNDPSATEQQKLEARLESTEIKTEVMVNTILFINEGPNAQAVGKGPRAATDADSRLGALENRMSASENQMKEIAKRYGLIYEPYVAPESSETPTAASRMEVIEKRYAHMNKMVKRLIKNAEADVEDAE